MRNYFLQELITNVNLKNKNAKHPILNSRLSYPPPPPRLFLALSGCRAAGLLCLPHNQRSKGCACVRAGEKPPALPRAEITAATSKHETWRTFRKSRRRRCSELQLAGVWARAAGEAGSFAGLSLPLYSRAEERSCGGARRPHLLTAPARDAPEKRHLSPHGGFAGS